MSPFTVEIDRRCQRGMHLRYQAPGLSSERLLHDMHSAFAELQACDEQWGPVTLHRLVAPFRFEVRARDDSEAVSFIHRLSASVEDRAADRTIFEAILVGALNPC